MAETKYVTTPDGRRITYDRWRYEQAVTQEATLKRVDTLITDAGARAVRPGRSLAQQEYGALLRVVVPNLLNDYGNINATAAVNYYDELRAVFRETYPDRRAQFSRNAVRSQADRYANARSRAALALNLTDVDDFKARFAPTYDVVAKTDSVVNYAMKIRSQYGHEPSVQAMNNALTREVGMFHRDTILFNSALDPYVKQVQRVAQASACEFCRLMALGSTNGTVRTSTYAAKFHDNCHCTIQPLYQGEEAIRPDYYDEFEKQYTDATRAAPNGRAKTILREMRKTQPKPSPVSVPGPATPAARVPSAKVTPGSLNPELTQDWYFLRPEGIGGLTLTELVAQRQLAKTLKLDESGYTLKKLDQPDTLEQAAKNTNPRFEESRLYKENCARVVNAYELRRRGFDVTANKKVGDNSQTDPVFQGTFINPETGATAWDERIVMSNRIKTERRAEQTALTLLSKYPEGARGTVTFSYRNSRGAGHVFNWEIQNQEVIWVDAQPNKVGDARKSIFEMASNISLTRLDDKVPNISVLQYLETGIE